jgi:hypothetical protein
MPYIDMTPTWRALLPIMCAVLENEDATEENKQMIREEFRRMAQAADQWNAHTKSQNEG